MRNNSAAADAASLDLFKRLPMEININILSYIGSPRELYHLIRASRFFYQLFYSDQKKYLLFALRRSYNPANLILGIRILKAGRLLLSPSSLGKPDQDEEFEMPDGFNREDWVLKHIGEHEKEMYSDVPENPLSGGVVEEEQSKNITRLYQLCRLWRIVDYFIEDYSRQILRHMKRIRLYLINGTNQIALMHKEAIHRYSLSRVEYDRIQRAFLYFELHRRLFGGQKPYIYRMRSVNIARAALDCMLLSHERAQLVSIYEYLTRRMAQIFKNIKVYILRRKEIMGENGMCRQEYFVFYLLQKHLERVNIQRSDTLAFLTELGLPFCRRFFSMPVSQQTLIVFRYDKK